MSVYSIDFDGTLCENAWPGIGADWYCDDKNYWLMPEGD